MQNSSKEEREPEKERESAYHKRKEESIMELCWVIKPRSHWEYIKSCCLVREEEKECDNIGREITLKKWTQMLVIEVQWIRNNDDFVLSLSLDGWFDGEKVVYI